MAERRIVGYADRFSAQAGDTISFKVSSPDPGHYQADIVRILGSDDPGGAGYREEVIDSPVSGQYPAREQPIRPGSYVVIDGSENLAELDSFTVHAMVYPTRPGPDPQAIVGRWDAASQHGWCLVLDRDGCVALFLDGECISTGMPLEAGRWAMATATVDGPSGTVRVEQQQFEAGPGAGRAHPPQHLEHTIGRRPTATTAPLLIGAWSDEQPGGFFNGKVDAVRLLRGVTAPERLHELRESRPSPAIEDVTGWWDFGQGIDSNRIIDISGNGLDGSTNQLPTRGVTGWAWTGEDHAWTRSPEHYSAIHFHDDDLNDAAWSTDFAFTVPESMPSGVYAVRLRQSQPDADGHVVFAVRPSLGHATADLAFLLPTATYLAYGNYRLPLTPNPLMGMDGAEEPNNLYLKEHPEVSGSLYDRHTDWSGVHYASRHRPLLTMAPRHNQIWGFAADANILAWLHSTGMAFDVITDEDLHRDGQQVLAPYRAVMTGSHPEYHSTNMRDAIDGYLGQGGRLIYMGGNGFYWRVAFHPDDPGTMEVRRAEDGTRSWIAQPGEYHHSFTGEYGGLWRRLGRPPNLTVGVGMAAQGFGASTYYRKGPGATDPRADFVFEGVDDPTFGDYGSVGGGAAGEEIDRFDLRLGSPAHGLVLASSEGHDQFMLRTKEEFLSTAPWFEDRKVRSDLVFFEGPNGGAVFSTGSIAWAGALAHNSFDNDIAHITENVTRRFCDPEPFVLPSEAGQ